MGVRQRGENGSKASVHGDHDVVGPLKAAMETSALLGGDHSLRLLICEDHCISPHEAGVHQTSRGADLFKPHRAETPEWWLPISRRCAQELRWALPHASQRVPGIFHSKEARLAVGNLSSHGIRHGKRTSNSGTSRYAFNFSAHSARAARKVGLFSKSWRLIANIAPWT